jgi:hypothetical protein
MSCWRPCAKREILSNQVAPRPPGGSSRPSRIQGIAGRALPPAGQHHLARHPDALISSMSVFLSRRLGRFTLGKLGGMIENGGRLPAPKIFESLLAKGSGHLPILSSGYRSAVATPPLLGRRSGGLAH